MKNSHLHIVCGLPFAAKSTLVRELVSQPGVHVVDVDPINAAFDVGTAGAVISATEWAASFGVARARVVNWLAAGNDVVYDGHCFERIQRDELKALAHDAGADATLIYVEVAEHIVRQRLLANRAVPQRQDVPDTLFEQAVKLLEPADSKEAALVVMAT